MSPKKKKQTQKRKKYLGPWFKAGRVIAIIGAILIIVAAIIDMVGSAPSADVWRSYTFGWLGIPYLPAILAIVFAGIILWLTIDLRFARSINLVVYAIVLIVLAIIAGNVGALVVIIGAIIIIFEELAKS
jgi:uncharacterized membrane protein